MSSLYEQTVDLMQSALARAHAQGVKGAEQPDRSDAERVTWKLVQLASHEVARRQA